MIPQTFAAFPETPQQVARLALACLDLTSLNDSDTEADVARLCERAQGPHGPVAAVCVWPRFAAFARRQLPANIAVAAVANFPAGGDDIDAALRDTRNIVEAGAQEVDLVLPHARLRVGGEVLVSALVRRVRRDCPNQVLKVILETGELADERLVQRASQISLDAGADFLKTSTGKTRVSATPEAAVLMLRAIAAHPKAASHAGFKASGGIRTVADAALYFGLCQELLGPQALRPARMRIGASSLLSDIEAVLGTSTAAAASAHGSY
jgi:deoxyribose-phosphate aldolase